MGTVEKSVDVRSVYGQPPEQDRLIRFKYARTAGLIYAWISLGLYSEILGPTLPTLMKLCDTNYEGIGSALAVREVGLFCGSLLGGYLADIWRSSRALLLASALAVAAVTNLLVPWCRSLPVLSTVLYVAGCAHGFLTTNGNPLLSSTWGAKAAGPFSLMHAGYGLGAAISPSFLSPFTTKQNQSEANSSTGNLSSSYKVVEYVDPVVPYGIVAGVLFLCAVGFVLIGAHDLKPVWKRKFISSSTSMKRTVMEEPGPDGSVRTTTAAAHRTRIAVLPWLTNKTRLLISRLEKHLVLTVALTFMTYFSIVCNERVFGKFIYSYATKGPVGLSADSAYLLHITYWLVFTGSRLLIFLLALRVSPRLLLGVLVSGTLISSVVFALIPPTITWLFLATSFFSLTKGPLFPAALGAINLSREISGRLVLVVNVGSACGGSLSQFIAGALLERYKQWVFPYIVIATACILLVIGALLIVYLRHVGNRFKVMVEKVGSLVEVAPFRLTASPEPVSR